MQLGALREEEGEAQEHGVSDSAGVTQLTASSTYLCSVWTVPFKEVVADLCVPAHINV